MGQSKNNKEVEGFEAPKHTQTPNKFYDKIMAKIDTLSELKVTLAIIRETFGWHKKSDRISQSQLMDKTGLSRDSVKNGLKKGIDRGTIVKISEYDRKKNQAAEYTLNFKNFDIEKEDLPSREDLPEGEGDPPGKASGEAWGNPSGEASGESLGVQNKYNKEILNKLASYGLDENSSIAKAVNKVWVTAPSNAHDQLNSYLDDGINKLSIILAVIKTQEESQKKNKHIINKLHYCKGILDDWLKNDVKTVTDVIEDDKKFEMLKQKLQNEQSRNKSSPTKTVDNTGIPIDI